MSAEDAFFVQPFVIEAGRLRRLRGRPTLPERTPSASTGDTLVLSSIQAPTTAIALSWRGSGSCHRISMPIPKRQDDFDLSPVRVAVSSTRSHASFFKRAVQVLR